MPEIKKVESVKGEKSSLAQNGSVTLEKSMTKQLDTGTFVKIAIVLTVPINASDKLIKEAVATERKLSVQIDELMDAEWEGILS